MGGREVSEVVPPVQRHINEAFQSGLTLAFKFVDTAASLNACIAGEI